MTTMTDIKPRRRSTPRLLGYRSGNLESVVTKKAGNGTHVDRQRPTQRGEIIKRAQQIAKREGISLSEALKREGVL